MKYLSIPLYNACLISPVLIFPYHKLDYHVLVSTHARACVYMTICKHFISLNSTNTCNNIKNCDNNKKEINRTKNDD